MTNVAFDSETRDDLHFDSSNEWFESAILNGNLRMIKAPSASLLLVPLAALGISISSGTVPVYEVPTYQTGAASTQFGPTSFGLSNVPVSLAEARRHAIASLVRAESRRSQAAEAEARFIASLATEQL